MRHPGTGGAGVVPESALDIHRAREWVRVSEAIAEADKDQLVLAEYGHDDLDAPAEAAKPKTRKSAAGRGAEEE